MKRHLRNLLTTLLFTLLGIALMIWIYRGFDFSPLSEIFAVRDNYLWISLSLLTGVGANLFRSFRWKMLLDSANISIKKRRAVELVFISYLINSVTPRLGELTRSLLVKRGDVAQSAKAFGTVVIEKLADVGCLIVVVTIAVLLRWEDTSILTHRLISDLQQLIPTSTLFWGLGASALILFALVWLKVKQIRALLHNLWQGITAIAHLEKPWQFIILCIAVWICNFLQLYLLLPCFENLSFITCADSIYLFAAASIGVLLPTPGGAGPWHFAIVKTMTGVFHTPSNVAKLFALVTHGLKTILVILLGIIAFLTFYSEVLRKGIKKCNKKTSHP